MKTIGLIGGMSPESTAIYYQLLNRFARERLGGLHSAKLLLWSFDFYEIAELQGKGDWPAATSMIVTAAQNLERGGAECLFICTNTMHKMVTEVQNAVDIPLLHIGDAISLSIKEKNVKKPLLLATRYTMEQDFYRGYLENKQSIDVAIPADDDRTIVHDIIYNELCKGVVQASSKQQYLDVVKRSEEFGIDGVIFGCTEVGLLISQSDFKIPTFDTTELHVNAALDFALS